MKFWPFCVVWYIAVSFGFFLSSCISFSSVRYVLSCLKLRLHWYIMWVFLAPPSAALSLLAIMSMRLRCVRLSFLSIWTTVCTGNDGVS